VAHVVGDRLRQMRRLTEHESGLLIRHAKAPAKVTLPSPQVFGQMSYKPGLTDQYYPTRAALMEHVAEIIRLEIAALLNDGIRYIQLDAPGYTYFADERLRGQTRMFGDDPDALLTASIRADNNALHGLHRVDAVLAIHLCRGNSRSQWLAEGSYDPIAERLFSSLDVDVFLLEYDSDRAGGFEPLRFVPPGKAVVLGLVSTKTPVLEKVDDLRRRIDEAARYVALDHLAISPQCGFASTAEGNLLTFDDQRRKLELVAQTARQVWG
jgi:5-methyltetrahydropteroyltriglutamate--homocysteine methyltransferase